MHCCTNTWKTTRPIHSSTLKKGLYVLPLSRQHYVFCFLLLLVVNPIVSIAVFCSYGINEYVIMSILLILFFLPSIYVNRRRSLLIYDQRGGTYEVYWGEHLVGIRFVVQSV